MVPPELQNNCALCGKLIEKSSDFIKETIGGRNFRFDTSDCAVMFKRLLSVYGDDFKQFLGNEQFISDPFWIELFLEKTKLKKSESTKYDNNM